MTATDQTTPAPEAEKAPRRWRWTGILLVASLVLNCLLGGAIAARWFAEERMERFSGASYTQLIPRRFMADLPGERRRELLGILGGHRKDFREGRGRLKAASIVIANALEAEPFDPEALNRATQDFGGEAFKLITRGSDVTREVVMKLSPEERKLLGKRIRERAEGRRSGDRERD